MKQHWIITITDKSLTHSSVCYFFPLQMMPCLYPLSNLKSYLLSLPLILGSFYILCISLLVMFHFTVSFRRLEILSFTPIWEQRFNLSSHMGIYNASVLSLFTNLRHLTTSVYRSARTALRIILVTGSPDSYHSEAPHPPLYSDPAPHSSPQPSLKITISVSLS